MPREGEKFEQYVGRRANDIARGIKAVMSGNLHVDLPIEEQSSEHEAQIETLVLGFNMMCRELERLDEIARHELDRAREYIRRQEATIEELSTPVIEIWDDVLVVPVVSILDSSRIAAIIDSVLQAVAERQARFVILDITGLDVVDTMTASHLAHVANAVRLLGAGCVLTGVSPPVARSLVKIRADLSQFVVQRTLKDGLRHCLWSLNGPRAGNDGR